MNTLFNEALLEIQKTKTIPELEDKVLNAINYLDFEFYSIYQEEKYPFTTKKYVLITNLNTESMGGYNRNDHHDSDQLMNGDFIFSIPSICNDKTSEHTDFMIKKTNQNEIRNSISIKIKGYHGERSIFSVSRKEGAISHNEILNKAGMLGILANECIKTFNNLKNKKDKIIVPTLSTREVEVIRWTCEGKTSAEIANILDISTRTVNFHINNVMEKLVVPNKVAAVAKAIAYNLII
ncbi:helix-turn-helix domain-containing protein [Photorhabdus heterorhabditis]|uniref:Transcriptional regulator n=1 Tax=Photorhabdus heterorhabditis TaxID=880156 RepID=A0A5B0W8G0_9GAMM|nr:helix-turn-helix transcriptional regulator [Photorhabdus heterorhabditis]KAA1183224.1 LuxR family transcriptional regulator [Photorhabdus heterorhabditis]KOY62237.1 transcriptional regulator [Photorhabdus heterorhabditis]MBS9441514.1 LuxR family transcriptional regulator [Photorhabdus heterorhabditis]